MTKAHPQDQMPLEFDFRPSLSGEDFLVADCNQTALAWLDRWPDWPNQGLVVWGPPGCGKSHLVNVFLAERKGELLDWQALETSSAQDLIGEGENFVLEQADALENEVALFHLYNLIREKKGTLLLTAEQAPARWSVRLPDLRSRLNALPTVEIGSPDDFLMEAVLVKHFSDRQLLVDSQVIQYLLARIERSFEAGRSVVEAIDRAALASKRNITVPLVRQVLNFMEEEEK